MPDPTPLEVLQEAVQTFASAVRAEEGYGPAVVASCVLAWEEVAFDEEGNTPRRMNYAITGDPTLATSIGLARSACLMIEHDVLGGDES